VSVEFEDVKQNHRVAHQEVDLIDNGLDIAFLDHFPVVRHGTFFLPYFSQMWMSSDMRFHVTMGSSQSFGH